MEYMNIKEQEAARSSDRFETASSTSSADSHSPEDRLAECQGRKPTRSSGKLTTVPEEDPMTSEVEDITKEDLRVYLK